MADQLSKLTKRADAVAESASVLVSRAIREIRGELSNLSRELNLAGNADDREGVYAMIRRKMNRLGRNLNRLLVAQNQAAAQGAAKAASDMTGLEIKYSAQRAKAICELVTPAQGENLAAVFTDKMGANMISTLREATVAALRQQAVAGGSMKELSRDMTERWFEAMKNEHPVFTDSAGHEWNTATYFQMNVRTNTMRVYNDCLVDNVARETGSDLMRISTGGDPSCAGCFPWEGCIISVSGKTKGFPTYEDARKGGCFHPNCTHTLQTVDEFFDADEIALQKAHPVDPDTADDADAQDERRYEIDQARKMRDEGLTAEQARVAVDRDNLAASIRHGLLRADAADMVAKMTDEQVTRLCPNGNPPEFVPAKKVRGGTRAEPKYERETWNHGSRGGVVHVKRDADLKHILSVTKADKPAESRQSDWNGHRSARNAPDDKSTARTERRATRAVQGKTDNIKKLEKAYAEKKQAGTATRLDDTMAKIGVYHDPKLEPSATPINPQYSTGDFGHTHNCGRCCDAYELRSRGYAVIAKSTVGTVRLSRKKDYMQFYFYDGSGGWGEMYDGFDPKNVKRFGNDPKKISEAMAEWGDGSRAKVMAEFVGFNHFFIAEQINGKTVFKDPQSGKEFSADDFKHIKNTHHNMFFRTDNLAINETILDSVAKEESSDKTNG